MESISGLFLRQRNQRSKVHCEIILNNSEHKTPDIKGKSTRLGAYLQRGQDSIPHSHSSSMLREGIYRDVQVISLTSS